MQFVWPSRFRILQLYIMGSILLLKALSLTFTENHKMLLLGLLLGSVDPQTRVHIAYTLFFLYTVKLHYVKCSVPCSDFWSAYQHFHQEFTGCFNCVILYLPTELGGICVFAHYPQSHPAVFCCRQLMVSSPAPVIGRWVRSTTCPIISGELAASDQGLCGGENIYSWCCDDDPGQPGSQSVFWRGGKRGGHNLTARSYVSRWW